MEIKSTVNQKEINEKGTNLNRLVAGFRALLSDHSATNFFGVPEREQRLGRMFVTSMVGQFGSGGMTLQEGWSLLRQHPQVIKELLELLDVLETRVDHLQNNLKNFENVPIKIHARYSRPEILAAFGKGTGVSVHPWREGVLWVEEEKSDLLAFTLDKTSGHFSPTTRYRDYAISPYLVHWESQSVTTETSPTGLRYKRHDGNNSTAMLFARLKSDDRSFWFLGPATYVSHSGESPMAITWKLLYPIPGDLYGSFAAAVA